jgi:octopine/nopaline transport system substrate-binding protein
MLKSFAAFLAAGAALLGATLAQAQDAKKWTTIRIATEGAFAPYNFTKPDGTLDGYEIELAKILCERMQARCSMEAQAFDGMIPALNAGKFDAIMAGMSATAKREEAIAFSIGYAATPQTFATLKSSPLAKLPHDGEVLSLTTDEDGAKKKLEDLRPLLKGKAIGVQGSTIGLNFLEKYMKDMVEIREYKTMEQHDLDLNSGRVDLTIASLAYLTSAVKKPENKDYVIVGPRIVGGVIGRGTSVGLRKSDPELKAMFDKAVQSTRDDGTISKLSMKWFGFDVTPR